MGSKKFFAFISDGITKIIGMVFEYDYQQWCENTSKALVIKYPKVLDNAPVVQNGVPVGFQTIINPYLPIKTEQKSVTVSPSAVHIFGEITESGGTEFCPDCQEFFGIYGQSIAKWRAEISGICLPGSDNIIGRIGKPNGR